MNIENMSAIELNSLIEDAKTLIDERIVEEATPICKEITRLLGQLNKMGVIFYDTHEKERVRYYTFTVTERVDGPMIDVCYNPVVKKKRGE